MSDRDELARAFLNYKNDDLREGLQYLLIRGTNTMGFSQPTNASLCIAEGLADIALAHFRASDAAPPPPEDFTSPRIVRGQRVEVETLNAGVAFQYGGEVHWASRQEWLALPLWAEPHGKEMPFGEPSAAESETPRNEVVARVRELALEVYWKPSDMIKAEKLAALVIGLLDWDEEADNG